MIALAFLGFCISELMEARLKEKEVKKQNSILTYSADYSQNKNAHSDTSIVCEKTPLIKRDTDTTGKNH